MNKEFEKIIEKLEDAKSNVTVNRLLDDIIKDKPKELGQLMAYNKAIEIVKQEAEQYTSTEHINCSSDSSTNGWIPCSERLTENTSTVLVQIKEFESPTIGWYGNIAGWRLLEKDFDELNDFTVIAWQPLPQPYQPKGEYV